MKTLTRLSAIASLLFFVACKKEPTAPGASSPLVQQDTHQYSSMGDFYAHNEVPAQSYTVDAAFGGSFTSPQGTVVTIPANAFVTLTGSQVQGPVVIQFKDIYKKSDMLLSCMDTKYEWYNTPLVSGGEFFIKAVSGNTVINLSPGQTINVNQPASLTQVNNLKMDGFILQPDSFGTAWQQTQTPAVQTVGDSLYNLVSYIFGLSYFSNPLNSGTWYNSDNASFFSAYNLVALNLQGNDDPDVYGTDVFLIFQGFNSLIHVYRKWNTPDFPYYYSPQGFQCTVVAIGVKNGKLYSAFVPVTINAAETVKFSLTETTTNDFKAQLKALN